MDAKTKALIYIAIDHVESHGGRVDVGDFYVVLTEGRLELGIIK